MSVDLLALINADGVDAKKFVTSPAFIGSVCFQVACARDAALRVGCDPLEGNPYHGEVWGAVDRPNRFSTRQKNALADCCTWFVEIPGVKLR